MWGQRANVAGEWAVRPHAAGTGKVGTQTESRLKR